jgi:hypothetical protein
MAAFYRSDGRAVGLFVAASAALLMLSLSSGTASGAGRRIRRKPTPTATPTPIPTNVGNEITINSPPSGQTVSGMIAINVTLGPDVYWDQLMVDGTAVTSASGNFSWDSTAVANGLHTLMVRAFQKGGTTPIGTAWVGVEVSNPAATASPTATATPSALPQTITISAPADGMVISADTTVADDDSTAQCDGLAWYDSLYVDGKHIADCNFGTCVFSPASFSSGAHNIAIHAHTANSPTGFECATSQNVSVTVSLSASPSTATPTPTPDSPVSGLVTMLPAIDAGQPLFDVTGDPSAIIAGTYNAKSYPSQAYGSYDDPNATMGAGGTVNAGFGPLLDDRQAASVTMATVETNVASSADTAANRYYQDHVVDSAADQQNYLNQLSAVNQYWSGAMATVMKRVDGACPIQNPTTAEIIQWAANKWGFNPKYGYAEACDEGDWKNTSLGDNGTSSGVFQVADRGANHGWSALVLANSNLARESTCYNADFFFATRWASFHCAQAGCSIGITGETPPNSMANAVESWFSGSSYSCPGGTGCDYQAMIYSDIVSGWRNAGYPNNGTNPPCWYVGSYYFNSAIPTQAPARTVPHE